MKKLYIICLLLLPVVVQVKAQTLNTRTASSFTVNGLKVIFKPTVKDVISVRMYFRGGVYNYPGDKAGIESFALKAATQCGTKKYSADAFRDIADKFGIDIGGSSTYDYGNIGMDCVKQYFDQGWDLFASAVNSPIFTESEVSLLKSKLITMASSQQGDPDKHIDDMVMKYAYKGTPYATDPDGDIISLTPITATDLRDYYAHILSKNRMFLVIAGNITRAQVEEKVKAFFAALPDIPYIPPVRTSPQWAENHLDVEGRELATNYITGVFNAPPINTPEFLAYRMGISGLGGSLFSELRTQLNLSYDPGASAISYLMPYGFMHVSTNSPKEAVEGMVRIISRVKSLGISDDGLKYLKSTFITSNYIKDQGSSAITANLGSAEINGGWEYAENLPAMLDKVTVEQINEAMLKYIAGIRWVYLGSPKLAQQADDAFSTAVH
ncbi:M16 family metallopeptidase [Mucilaginibacter ginkgonis]|uniref:Insulinase family protein n=1 Tax=Mucilaginibacter ginkgonis TaxID=2682091 RepID=A0A6I4I3X7_9SPHI|nr:pitrilysin family protein [Mucilaginibacter ginkgonis]QQL48693.1 insulinase family protein [Mucilaginibacter ginkgonis]